MAAIFQTTSSHAFSWMKMYKFWLIFHWSLFPKVQSIIFQHWFRKWLGAVQATSHYLNQCCLVSWRIYASLGLNELKRDLTHRQIGEHGTILHHSKHDCEVVMYHTGNLTFNYMITPIKITQTYSVALPTRLYGKYQFRRSCDTFTGILLGYFTGTGPGPVVSDVTQGLYSLGGMTSYRKISWSFGAARFGFRLFQLLWHLTGPSVAALARCLSNYRAIQSLQHPTSRLRYSVRFSGKTSYRLVNEDPGGCWWNRAVPNHTK